MNVARVAALLRELADELDGGDDGRVMSGPRAAVSPKERDKAAHAAEHPGESGTISASARTAKRAKRLRARSVPLPPGPLPQPTDLDRMRARKMLRRRGIHE